MLSSIYTGSFAAITSYPNDDVTAATSAATPGTLVKRDAQGLTWLEILAVSELPPNEVTVNVNGIDHVLTYLSSHSSGRPIFSKSEANLSVTLSYDSSIFFTGWSLDVNYTLPLPQPIATSDYSVRIEDDAQLPWEIVGTWQFVTGSGTHAFSVNPALTSRRLIAVGGATYRYDGQFTELLNARDLHLSAESIRSAIGAAATGVTSADVDAAERFDMWGDSLTAGAGGTPWPTAFAASTGYTVFNGGVGGENSIQIKARFDAAAVSTRARNTVFWVGRNNYSNAAQVKADIAGMVAALGHERYLVLGVINGAYGTYEQPGGTGYNQITALNADLQAIYGERYFDIRDYLVNDALAALGITPTSQDLTDISNNTPPTSLRSDALHLNSNGYNAVNIAVQSQLGVVIASDMRAMSPSNALALLGNLPPQSANFTPKANLANTLGSSILRWLHVYAGSGTFSPSGSNSPLNIFTCPSAAAGGGVIIYASAGGEKWRYGLRHMTSGAEGNDLSFGYFNGTTRTTVMLLSGTGGISTPLDMESTDSSRGVILKSPNGTRWRISVNDAGAIASTAI